MKTLHEIRTDTLFDYLRACWPLAEPRYNDRGYVEFWELGRCLNTMPSNSWDAAYANWLAAGAPRDRNEALRVSFE